MMHARAHEHPLNVKVEDWLTISVRVGALAQDQEKASGGVETAQWVQAVMERKKEGLKRLPTDTRVELPTLPAGAKKDENIKQRLVALDNGKKVLPDDTGPEMEYEALQIVEQVSTGYIIEWKGYPDPDEYTTEPACAVEAEDEGFSRVFQAWRHARKKV